MIQDTKNVREIYLFKTLTAFLITREIKQMSICLREFNQIIEAENGKSFLS